MAPLENIPGPGEHMEGRKEILSDCWGETTEVLLMSRRELLSKCYLAGLLLTAISTLLAKVLPALMKIQSASYEKTSLDLKKAQTCDVPGV